MQSPSHAVKTAPGGATLEGGGRRLWRCPRSRCKRCLGPHTPQSPPCACLLYTSPSPRDRSLS
eukprot:6758298-Pyramimonas_sp.AAC.1